MESSEDQLVIGRRSALKMLGLGSAAMLTGGFSDVLAAESKEKDSKSKSTCS